MAVGVVDMALWDLVAKIEGAPLYRVLGERYRGGEVDDDVFVYAAGGYYYPGKDLGALQDEIKVISIRLQHGQDQDRRRAVGGRPQAHRGGY